jgi:hypothetical protein
MCRSAQKQQELKCGGYVPQFCPSGRIPYIASATTLRGYGRVLLALTSPRPSLVAVALAASLLTTTAGRVLAASEP